MSIDTGHERIDEGKPPRRTVGRLIPAATPAQTGELPASSPSRESADQGKPRDGSESRGPKEIAREGIQRLSPLSTWLDRLGGYGLALLLVGLAALLHWALWDVLSPTPFLVFYLAWVGGAAFGGLGPGLLATLASWLCVDLFFDPTPWHVSLHDPGSVGRLMVLLTGGLAVSVVGETMRRSRIRARRQGRELADLNAVLRASEEKYRIVADNTYDWEFWLDPEDRFLYTSPSCERVTGYGAPVFLDHPALLLEIIHPEDLPALLEDQRETPPRHHGDIEFRIITKMGEIRWIHHLCQPVYDKDGRYAGCRGSNRDITERKRAEEALRASEEKYRFLVENSKDITWTVDLQGRWTFISSNMEKVTGYRADELIGKMLWDFLAPESRDLVKEKLRRRAGGEDVPPYEVLFVGKDGRHMPFEVLAASIVDDGGNIVGVQGVARDITERKRAEEALRESEKHYRGIVEDQTELICLFESDETITSVNDAYCRYFGKRREELVGHKFLPLIAEEDQEAVKAGIAALNRENPFVTIEQRVRRPDGSIAWQEWKNRAVFDGHGHLTGYQAVARDITERKRAEQDLRESRDKYQALIETTADFIWEMDASGKYTYCSPQMKGLWGYEPEDMIGKTPFDVMPPEDRKQALASFMSLAKSPKLFTRLEASSYDSRGRLIAVEISGVPFFDADGRLLGYRGISRDVTERKRAEEALRSSQSMLQSVMGNVPQGVFWKDRHSTYLGCNNVFAKAIGLESPGDIVGKTDYDLPWLPEQTASFREYDRRIMDNDAPEYHIIEQMREADGKLAWVETNKAPLHDAQGHVIGILGTYEDITERKRAEGALHELNATLESKVAQRTEELEHRARQLQKLTLELTEAEERERKRLAEILHDDLQQVLAAAKFQVGLLDGRVRNDAELQEIAEQAKDLLADAIVKSRSLSHELSAPVLAQSDLCEAFEWLAEQMQKKHGFTVHVDVCERIEVASEPLRVLLYKAAQESLFNVIKHAGVHEATLRLRHQRGRIRLSVSDEGRGFNPTEPGYNLGFGLLSIRERVAYLGGRMKVRSAPGKGSIFLITLPDAEGSP